MKTRLLRLVRWRFRIEKRTKITHKTYNGKRRRVVDISYAIRDRFFWSSVIDYHYTYGRLDRAKTRLIEIIYKAYPRKAKVETVWWVPIVRKINLKK